MSDSAVSTSASSARASSGGRAVAAVVSETPNFLFCFDGTNWLRRVPLFYGELQATPTPPAPVAGEFAIGCDEESLVRFAC